MINGQKVRGSDHGLNLIIIDGTFHKVSPDLVSFEMQMAGKGMPHIYCIGYSKHLRKMFIQYMNGMHVFYENVPLFTWQARRNYDIWSDYFAENIKDFPSFETTDEVRPLPNQYILDAYNKLEYYRDITEGLWATDRPDKVIDPDGILFQIESPVN